jgi:hypothetical protein
MVLRNELISPSSNLIKQWAQNSWFAVSQNSPKLGLPTHFSNCWSRNSNLTIFLKHGLIENAMLISPSSNLIKQWAVNVSMIKFCSFAYISQQSLKFNRAF